jgi:hypothetical protein
MHLSNTLKAEHDAKLLKKKKLLEELQIVQAISKQDRAFDRVLRKIDEEFAEENKPNGGGASEMLDVTK